MEELFVYALLCAEGIDMWDAYAKTLDKLFMEDIDNDIYFSLEEMELKDSILHYISIMYQCEFKIEYFGKILMQSLQRIYETMHIELFAKKMYSLWNKLPQLICEKEPFFILAYADDCLSYGDKSQCEKLYEIAMHYYD
ncbi:MAG: hypothetical protein NC213_07805 [Acetobacter sp.]|nr:hypothetical protein [Bacteroides sp.]MCM1341634.1 hypothetical protein [Acetobacter sp.]MCM1434045.1 hypothetical protein [Clostridiales bacterium]